MTVIEWFRKIVYSVKPRTRSRQNVRGEAIVLLLLRRKNNRPTKRPKSRIRRVRFDGRLLGSVFSHGRTTRCARRRRDSPDVWVLAGRPSTGNRPAPTDNRRENARRTIFIIVGVVKIPVARTFGGGRARRALPDETITSPPAGSRRSARARVRTYACFALCARGAGTVGAYGGAFRPL